MSTTDVLPGGYWDAAGRLHREFELGTLTGREEEMLAGAPSRQPAALVTEVLSRCLRRLGDLDRVPPEVTRRLLVEDRNYLLLRLRAETFGEYVHGSLTCPWPDCGERVSIGFSLADIPVEEPPHRAPLHALRFPDGDSTPEIAFRLPDGGDEEELAAVGSAAPPNLLLARCVQRIGTEERPAAARVAALPVPVRAALEERMRQLAPKVELTMEAVCAECGRTFAAPFDLRRFFLGELRTDRELLTREVHFLAFHYHWGEQEIMAMTREKRRRYVDVLAAALAALDADAGQPGLGYGQRPPVWSVPAAASLPSTGPAAPLPEAPAPTTGNRPAPAGAVPGPPAAVAPAAEGGQPVPERPAGSGAAVTRAPATTVVIPDNDDDDAGPRQRQRTAETHDQAVASVNTVKTRTQPLDRGPADSSVPDVPAATAPRLRAARPAGAPPEVWPAAATAAPVSGQRPPAQPAGQPPAGPPLQPAAPPVRAGTPAVPPLTGVPVDLGASPLVSPSYEDAAPAVGATPPARRESRGQAQAGRQRVPDRPDTTTEPPAAARRQAPAAGRAAAAVPADRPVPPGTAAFWDRRYLSRQPLRVLR